MYFEESNQSSAIFQLPPSKMGGILLRFLHLVLGKLGDFYLLGLLYFLRGCRAKKIVRRESLNFRLPEIHSRDKYSLDGAVRTSTQTFLKESFSKRP